MGSAVCGLGTLAVATVAMAQGRQWPQPSPRKEPTPVVSSTTSGSASLPLGERPLNERIPLVIAYAGPSYISFQGGDFNGETFAIKPRPGFELADVVFVPELAAGPGFEAGACAAWVCFAYGQNWVDARLGGLVPIDSALVKRLSFGLRGTFRVLPQWVPYFTFGMDVVWIRLRESHAVGVVATEELRFDDRETSLEGLGLEIGTGSILQIAAPFAIDIGIGYRALSVKTIDGEPLDESFGASAWFVRGGPALIF